MPPRAISEPHAAAPARHGKLPPAAAVLGRDHPVARAARTRRAIGGQLAVASALLAGSAADLLVRGHTAATLFAGLLVVELCLVSAFAFADSRLHERARDVVADIDHPVPAAEIAAERARLASPRRREQLARSLERAVYAAAHWHELAIASRPPPTVRQIGGCADTAREVIRLVRDPGTSVRGVALLGRLVCGGYGAALYAGSADTLARELGRIRFLLETTSGRT